MIGAYTEGRVEQNKGVINSTDLGKDEQEQNPENDHGSANLMFFL